MFQDILGEVFVIDETVHPPKSIRASEDADDILTLVDADGASCQPNRYIISDYKHCALLASPPRGSDDLFVMGPWS